MTYGFDNDLNKVQVVESDQMFKVSIPVTRGSIGGGFEISLTPEQVYNLLGDNVGGFTPILVEYRLDQYTYVTATEPQAYCVVGRVTMTNQLSLRGTCPQPDFDIVITFLKGLNTHV